MASISASRISWHLLLLLVTGRDVRFMLSLYLLVVTLYHAQLLCSSNYDPFY